MERTNIRFVTHDTINVYLDFVSIDVSFISLKLVLPVAFNLLNPNGHVICLIKPQFEAGRGKVGKNGVIKDKSVHCEVIEKVQSFAQSIGFSVLGIDFSPVKGPKGNIEYLIHLEKSDANLSNDINISAIVDTAHIEAH